MLRNIEYETIMREYQRRQTKSRHEQEDRQAEVYRTSPRFREIDNEIAALSVQKTRELLMGEPSTFNLKSRIQLLAQERRRLLEQYGFPPDYLLPRYQCSLCQDTGYIGHEKCSCFKKAVIDLLYGQSNLQEILEKENFDHFSFDYYSDKIKNDATGLSAKETAQAAFSKAKNFTAQFDTEFQNLFLYGDTGVGKTFLSHCIAKELLDSAHSVFYFSSFDLFDLFAQKTFTKNISADEIDSYIFNCDLLIIDDLGTEMTNTFVSSQLFLCINERLMHKKSTIISTNLTLENFSDTYSERTFSRIASNFDMIKLIGKDIRIQKLFLGGNKHESK